MSSDITCKQILICQEILSVRSGPEKSLCMAIPPIRINSVWSIVIVIVIVISVVRPLLHKVQWTDFSSNIGIIVSISIIIGMVGPRL